MVHRCLPASGHPSPSSRRAWVEISQINAPSRNTQVALLAEGVGRNGDARVFGDAKVLSPSSRRAWVEITAKKHYRRIDHVALLAEGVGRNTDSRTIHITHTESPSSRRAWVEMRLCSPG